MVKWVWLVRMNNLSTRHSYQKLFLIKTYVYKSKKILLFFLNFSNFLFFFCFFWLFLFLCFCSVFFPLRAYVSNQASVIIAGIRQWQGKKRKRKRWKRESRSPSLVIIILAYCLSWVDKFTQFFFSFFFWQPIYFSS